MFSTTSNIQFLCEESEIEVSYDDQQAMYEADFYREYFNNPDNRPVVFQPTANVNCTRATVDLLNGQQTFIMLIAPRFTPFLEESEIANIQLKSFLQKINPFAQIKSYQVDIGAMDAHGKYIPSGIVYPQRYLD